jgi:hypothetical protein
LTVGSPALLLKHLLPAGVTLYDPRVGDQFTLTVPGVFVIGCKHPEFATYDFPMGSVVIDPHRYIPDQEAVRVIRLGERR